MPGSDPLDRSIAADVLLLQEPDEEEDEEEGGEEMMMTTMTCLLGVSVPSEP